MIDWFVNNIVNRAVTIFLQLLEVVWHALGVTNEYLKIGFWPSFIFTTTALVFWNALIIYIWASTRDEQNKKVRKKRIKRYLTALACQLIFFGLLLRDIYSNEALQAGRSYILLAVLYLFTVVMWIYGLIIWLKTRLDLRKQTKGKL